jgi:N-methylhydantoinase A
MAIGDDLNYNLGVDVGGTFTDVIVFDQGTQGLTIEKVLSTPDNPSVGVMNGVEEAMEKAEADPSQLQLVNHGTTVVTNMILEEAGAEVGLLVTEGYKHTLQLARAWTPGPLYGWIDFEKPEPLADLEVTRGIDARLDETGNVVSPVDESQVVKAVGELYEEDIEALAVMLINSYVDSSQEERVREIVNEEFPDLPVSISAEDVSEYGEYERTMTAIINAYARPQIIKYLDDLNASLQERGMQGTLNIIRSDGGTMSTQAAKRSPVNLVLSGPSGGVVGSAYLADTLDTPDVLTLDMGGTSTDVSLVEDGQPSIRRETEVGYRSFKARTVDINTVGAGGGSIARIQVTGSLEVGPESAGADPGPACYGQGGTEPTVTDANVVLGRIPQSVKLGGTLDLDRDAAEDVIGTLADQRDMSIEDAAQGIIDMVNQNIHSALRVVSVEKGYDPREFGLVAFGGAGPMHANALGKLIQSSPVIIPPGPGVMSAFGFLTSDVQNEFTETYIETEEDVDGQDVYERIQELKDDAADWLASEGIDEADREYDYSLDCRYYRQDIQMTIPLDMDELVSDGLTSIREQFETMHENQYDFRLDAPLEIASLRVIGRGTVEGVRLSEQPLDDDDPSSARIDYEDVFFDETWHETPIYQRRDLTPGDEIAGPAIVVEDDATTVIQPDNSARVNEYACLEIRGKDGL